MLEKNFEKIDSWKLNGYYRLQLQRTEMKVAQAFTYWFCVCCAPLLIIVSNICWEVNATGLYEYGFDKYKISQVTGMGEAELKKVARHLIDYFNLEVDSAQVTVVKQGQELALFSERELVHLQDIRKLVQLGYWVQVVVFVLMVICVLALLLWFKNRWLILVRCLFWGSVATFGVVVVLAVWSILGFAQLFLLFHLVSFPNVFWILDPARDYLIMLFPEGFFYDAALFGFGAVLLEAFLVGGFTFGMLRLQRADIVERFE